MVGVIMLAMREHAHRGQNEIPSLMWEVICLLVSLSGLAIRIFTIGHASKGTSGRNTKKHVADTLNTTGAYSLVRNPLYLGNFVIGLGFSLFVCLWWLTLIYILTFWLYYERIIFAEEEYLRNKFGDDYLVWANETPAFVPRFRDYKKPEYSFSYRKVLRNEYNSFFTIILTLYALEVASDLISQHKFELDIGWAVIVSIGFVVWTTLRILKKRTALLRSDGR